MDALQLFVLLFVTITVRGQESRLGISIATDNSFNISISGQQWFRSGPVQVRHKGTWLSSANGSLILTGNASYVTSGADALGKYDYFYFEYHSKPRLFQSPFKFTTFIKTYNNIDVITFGHIFNSGAEGAAEDSVDDVISSFPSILVEDSPLERGYVTFAGNSKLITLAPPTVLIK